LPCVGTPLAFEGLPHLPASLLKYSLHETVQELARAIVALHRDEEKNTRCAQAGLDYISTQFNASRIDTLIEEIARPARDRHRARRTSSRASEGQFPLEITHTPEVAVLTFGGAASPPLARSPKSATMSRSEAPAILDVGLAHQPRRRRRAR